MIKESDRFISVLQAKEFDIQAQRKFGMPVLLLMENSGRAVAEEARESIENKKKISVICGKGNNGGDGFVAARHLLSYGFDIEIFLASKISEIQGEARVNLDILRRLKAKITEFGKNNLSAVRKKILKSYLIIDALLGVGLRGQVKGIYRDLIGIINSSEAYVLSVDVPSGLDADSGIILSSCVKADKTVTFVAKKKGMILNEGPKYCGRVVVRDLGIPF